MYEWQNPATGTVELSGKPPAWYRGNLGGPRVRVFDDGVLVDDTIIDLPPKYDQQMRESAFQAFERQQAEAVKRLERIARKRREAARRDAQTEEVAAANETPAESTSVLGSGPPPEELDQGVINQLKSLIQNWDRQLGGAEAQ